MKKLIITAAFVFVMASPVLAQSYDPDVGSGNIAASIYAPVAPYGHVGGRDTARAAFAAIPPSGLATDTHAGSKRVSAMRECSEAARRYTESTWGTMEGYQYRTCMASHGQPE